MFSRGLFFLVTQISQMTQIFLCCFFFFPQISQMHTDFRPVRSGISQILDLFGLGFRRFWTCSVLDFADFYYLCSMNRKKIKKKFTNLGQRMLRMPRTRGFGVQSPTAYSFLRKVVNEKGFLRIYCQTHSEISSSYPQDAPRQKRLLFRIRTVYPNVVELSASSLLKREDFQQFLWNVSDDTVLVVTDINLDAEYGKVWLRLVTDNRTVLTFNLVDCGIVFFDKTKYKQNFNVNY